MLRGFISYSHKDAALCHELLTRLAGFKREGRAEFWSDHAIDVGEQWHPAIMQALNNSDIAILLLSPDLYASDFIWQEELPRAKELWQQGKLTVVSVRIRAGYEPKVSLYQWLRDEQQIPRDDRAVTSQPNRDEAWREVIVEIDRTIDRILQQRESRISSRAEVDAAISDARVALKHASEIARQIPDELCGLARSDIEAALDSANAALGADTNVIKDELISAHGRLRRCKFPRDEHNRLHQALADLRDQIMATFEAARDAGFPGDRDGGMPTRRFVPENQIVETREEVRTRLDELDVRVKELETYRQRTLDATTRDAAIDQVVEQVGQQSGLARELLSEPEVDIEGVGAAIEGAARAVGRFAKRIVRYASKELRSTLSGLASTARKLMKAGHALHHGRAKTQSSIEMDLDAIALELVGGSDEDGDAYIDVQWFIARDGKQHGPLSGAEMIKLVELQHLRAHDLLWRRGFSDWRVATAVFPAIGNQKRGLSQGE